MTSKTCIIQKIVHPTRIATEAALATISNFDFSTTFYPLSPSPLSLKPQRAITSHAESRQASPVSV